ncbi:MAG: SDR family NAD(P)-dependent oxidoreductase [Planctomycetota bacterium]
MSQERLFQELFDLTGRVALVTGGSKGLGREMAGILAEAGADVGLCSRNAGEAARAAAEIAQATGRRTLGLAADAARAEEVSRLVRAVEDELGPIDILIPNAGINIRKELDDLSDEDWDSVQAVNLRGAFLVARAVLPGMRARKHGRIIFLGSILSFVSIVGRAAYASSKAALLGLARTLAIESAADGVCVNILCPGPFATPMNQVLVKDEEQRKAFFARLPIGRYGDPRELRGITLFLAGPSCSFMTGASVLVDGGWTAL